MKLFWQFIISELKIKNKVALLYVVESNGSSPGRQGFKMLVTESGTLVGSIGGGIMEHKLVEFAKRKLYNNDSSVLLKKQIHSDSVNKDRSGMICSGEQTICMLLIEYKEIEIIQKIINIIENEENQLIKLSSKGIGLIDNENLNTPFSFTQTAREWQYLENLNFKDTIYIIGSGHVGLALARQMKWLGFHVKIYDDREKLNTFEANKWADEKIIINYQNIGVQIPEGNNYVVLVSFGYRTDKKILKQLLQKQYKYLGMMGSKSKIKTLIEVLKKEGFEEKKLSKVYAPIGINIQSKTPEEIAVSIAAEIIRVKNRVR